MMDNEHTGLLVHEADAKLFRTWFKEMCRLQGIKVIYRTIKAGVTDKYDDYGELDDLTENPTEQWVIFEEYPSQRTMQKLGWNTEALETCPILHVPYDLPNLERGCMFIIQSGVDSNVGRVFKVLEFKNDAMYPYALAVKLGPVIASDFDRTKMDHSDNDFSVFKDIDSDAD